jgi:TolA-binding protein
VRARLSLVLLALALTTWGCAYFNTFYAAKKNFEAAELARDQSTDDPEGRANAGQAALYDKAIEGATKVVIEYSKSKWVDDAILLIGRSMLAKGDYVGAQRKFAELGSNFPNSELMADAVYWSAVAADRDKRPSDAIALYDSVLVAYPKSKNFESARLRRSNLYLQEKQAGKAIEDLRELATKPGDMGYDAGLKLADALFAQHDYPSARAEYLRVAERAPTEQQRLEARLRAGDCEEASGDYAHAADSYLKLLHDSKTDDAKARARLRYGNALALGGDVDRGLVELGNVVDDYPRTPFAAEALFRTGYLHEVVRDDFDAAGKAYDRVSEQSPGSPFAIAAKTRRDNLAQVAATMAASKDTSAAGRAAEAALRQAENDLFQLGRPEHALENYDKAEKANPTGPLAPRAAFARGWVLARRLGRNDEAKTAFEDVIARYPESPEAAAAQRLLANPNDSTFTGAKLAGTAMQFPMVPGNPLYIPPPPVNTPRKGSTATRTAPAKPGPPGAPVAAGTLPDSLAVPDSLARAMTAADSAAARAMASADSLRLAKLKARADSVRAARRKID